MANDADGAAQQTVDGRVLRGERTRSSIVRSLIDLLEEGNQRPTAREIADRAGVSVRSIFQHFDDLEGLYADLIRVQAARVLPLVEALEPDGDLATRIEALVAQRAALFETIAPMRRSVGIRARQSPAVRERFRSLSDTLFAQILDQFAPEMSAAGKASEPLAHAIDALTSYETWDRFRDHHHLSVEDSSSAVRLGLIRLLV